VYIDVIGTLPTPDQVRAFLADKDPNKRTRVIEQLLAHPRRHSVWAWRLGDHLDLGGAALDRQGTERTAWAQMGFDWLRQRVARHTPYDEIVRDILLATTAEGRSPAEALQERRLLGQDWFQGLTDRYRQRRTLDVFWMRKPGREGLNADVFGRHDLGQEEATYAEVMAERVAGAFLGVGLECARCHNHPLDVWTPQDHRAFTAFFATTRYDRAGGVRSEAAPDAAPGARGLGATALAGPGDRREALARWVTGKDNPFFARAFVNRVWAWYFGRGLAEPGGLLSPANPPSHPELLDALARDFAAHGYDLRRLERLILFSATYQLSATPTEHNKHDRTQFSRFPTTPLPKRLLLDLVLDGLDVPLPAREPLARGRRAVEYRGTVAHPVLHDDRLRFVPDVEELAGRFGREDLVARCAGPTWGYGSPLYANPIAGLFEKSKRLQALAQSKASLEEGLQELCLALLSRELTPRELKSVRGFLDSHRQPADREAALLDIAFALVNAQEFQFKR
jgi:hypothetical protein